MLRRPAVRQRRPRSRSDDGRKRHLLRSGPPRRVLHLRRHLGFSSRPAAILRAPGRTASLLTSPPPGSAPVHLHPLPCAPAPPAQARSVTAIRKAANPPGVFFPPRSGVQPQSRSSMSSLLTAVGALRSIPPARSAPLARNDHLRALHLLARLRVVAHVGKEDASGFRHQQKPALPVKPQRYRMLGRWLISKASSPDEASCSRSFFWRKGKFIVAEFSRRREVPST